MNKLSVAVASFFLSAAICQAQAIKAGLHTGYTVNGDVEDKGAVFGAQVGMKISEELAVEFSGTMFSDSDEGVDIDVKQFALTGKYIYKLMDGLDAYGGAGISYNMFDGSGDSMNVDMDNKIGFHLCAGLEWVFAEKFELFGEYRYSFMKVGGTITFRDDFSEMSQSFDEDYNFGMLRIGVNYLF